MIHISVYFILLATFVLGISTYTYVRKPNKTYGYLLILSTLVSVWLLPFGLIPIVRYDVSAMTGLMRVSNVAAAWLPAIMYFVITSLVLRGQKYPSLFNSILVSISAFISVMNGFSPLVIQSVDFRESLIFEFGPLAIPFAVIYGALYVAFPFRLFMVNWRHARGKELIQMKYMALGLIVSMLVGLNTNTILPVFFQNTNWYIIGTGVSFVAVSLIYYAFNEERLYDLDIMVGPLFKTRKHQFHLLLKNFISRLPLYLSYEKIVKELSTILDCAVGIELFDQERSTYGVSGEIIPSLALRRELAIYLAPGQIIRYSTLGTDPRSLKLAKILEKGDIETVVPLATDNAVIGFLYLGHKSLEIIYSKQDFEQLLLLCNQLTLTAQVIDQTDQRVEEKESEITRLSQAIESLKPATLKNDIEDYPMLIDETHPLVGDNSKLKQILVQAKKVAKYDTPVLLTGETGTGKENLAKAIHRLSGRSRFVAVNCSAIPENLIESELFGFKKGAFTGADRNKNGLIAEAHGGTLFLDEIGDLPYNVQAKLLRVLQDGAVQPLGDVQARYVDVRIIAATNSNLTKMIADGRFREDLFHRIQVIHFEVPPLRDRGDDVILLAHYFLDQFNRKYNKSCQMSQAFIGVIQKFPWSGNIRELENKINRLVCLAGQNDILTELDQTSPQPSMELVARVQVQEHEADLSVGLKQLIEQTKREIIVQALNRTRSQKLAAELLKLKPSNLSMYLKKYNISLKELQDHLH
jgi:transcriptional regulator with PAS, ATPase and Fis domain